MYNIDFSLLLINSLKSLRAERSKSWLSLRLGYNKNQVYYWESSKRKIYWRDFEKICDFYDLKLNLNLHNFFGTNLDYKFLDLLKTLTLNDNRAYLSLKTSISDKKLSRLLTGASPITFQDACTILNEKNVNFIGFIQSVLGTHMSPDWNLQLIKDKKQINIFHEQPNMIALAQATLLKSYRGLEKHEDGVLSKTSGLSVQEVKEGLAFLLNKKVLSIEDNLYKLDQTKALGSNNLLHFKASALYWMNKSHQIIDEGKNKVKIAYRVSAVSQKSLEKIETALYTYYNEISKACEEADHEELEHIVIMSTQSVTLASTK